jgi:Flp pilus assembly protein TadD
MSNTRSVIQEECAIAGRVLYGNNLRGAENVPVHLEKRRIIRDRTYTMSMGRFEFRGLAKGHYTIVAQAEGFQTTRHAVNLIYFCQNRANTITLQPETIVAAEKPAAPMVSARELEIPGKARKAFQKGVRELDEGGNAEKGLKHFQKAIKIHPDYDDAYVHLAVANLQLKDPVAAQEALETAVSVYPENARAQVLLGMMYGGQGDLDAAVATLQRGVDADENYWLGHYELGKALVNQERHQEALPHAQRAHELNPQNAGVHLLLHDVTLQLKDLETALAEVKEYIELYPDADIVPRLRQHADILEHTLAAVAQ